MINQFCVLFELNGFCRVWLHRMAMFGFCLSGWQMVGGLLIRLKSMTSVLIGCWLCSAPQLTWRSLSVEGISHSLMPFMALNGLRYWVEALWANGDRNMKKESRKRWFNVLFALMVICAPSFLLFRLVFFLVFWLQNGWEGERTDYIPFW